jgi:D-aminoacyl-tRNA deacylase
MRVVLQRVSRAAVRVRSEIVGEIGRGFLLLVGVGKGDPAAHVERLADKIAGLRVFADGQGKMNLALADVGGEVLVVSQFTLYGDVRKGRRPSWTAAEDPEVAEPRVEALAVALESRGLRVARGRFGADMQVELVNDGPVTLILDADLLAPGSRG